jgi:ubiquinone biosynthesis protein
MYKSSVRRFREIIKVLAFYGFGSIVDGKIKKKNNYPENLRKAFEELGPTFIKIGQILSTRPDLIPDNYIKELSKLQDSAPKENFEDIENVFNIEFNKKISDSFLYFDKNPLASASIAEVHCARLKDGRDVIVKIQRPGIADNMRLDIHILKKIFSLTRAKFEDAIIDPKEALDEILSSTELELDFKNEAENLKKFSDLNKDVAFIYCPYLIEDLCSTRVLTMEKIDGFKIDNLKKLDEEGYDAQDVGYKLALSYFKQIFKDGFFHGDPHPGNLLIRDGKICFIDFGIMGNLNSSLKSVLNDMIFAIATKNVGKMVSCIMSIGIKKGYVNRNRLYEDIDYLYASYLSTSLQNIKISVMLQEVFDTAKRNNLKLPRDLTILIRGLVIIEGVVAKIAPDVNIMDIAVPYVKSGSTGNLLKEFNPDELLASGLGFIKDTVKIPGTVMELIDSILAGRIKVQLEHNNLQKPVNQLNKMVNRLVFALIVSSMIIGSSLILNSNAGPKVYNISIIGVTGFGAAAVLGIWLLISIIRSGRI